MNLDSSIYENLDNARNLVVFDNTAQTVLRHLKDLENKRDLVMSRWIWELLQNARDAAPENGELRVRLSSSPEHLIFRHNGTPFTDKEIAHLIYHGSTKQRGKGHLGQFGIGFLSTHLISKKIDVRGQLASGHAFKFVLNREGTDFGALSEAMKVSWEQFKESLRLEEGKRDTDFTTEYTYPLCANTINVVEAGVRELKDYAPFVLAFNTVFKSIEIEHANENIKIIKGELQLMDDGLYIIKIRFNHQATRLERYVALSIDEDLSIAFMLQNENGQLVVDSQVSMPKIFIAFPLSDTCDFSFPAVINSESFAPNPSREAICLAIAETEDNQCNQQLISRSCHLLLKLLEHATKNRWQKAHNMTLLGKFKEKNWLNEAWYKKLVEQRIIDPLRAKNIFVTLSGGLIPPKNAWIPIGCNNVSNHELWDLTAKLKDAKNKVPIREDGEDWRQILVSWANFLGRDAEQLPEGFTLQKLAEYVAGLATIQRLDEYTNENTKPIDWLNQLHLFLYKAGLDGLFEELTLLPNQKGELKKQADLWLDCDIDERLKDIAESLGINIKEQLLHSNITLDIFRERLHSKSNKNVLLSAVQVLKELSEQRAAELGFRKANVDLFTWIIENGWFESLEGFPVLTEAPSDTEHVILTLTKHISDQDSKPLAPSGSWPDKAQPFMDLFPKRLVLSSKYFDECEDTNLWKQLEEQGYMRTSPLYKGKENIDGFLPDEPLQEVEKNKRHRALETCEVSMITFLEKKNIGLLDTSRKSKKRATALLKFLVEFVLQEDLRAFDQVKANCECGDSHRYYIAGWLIPLKHRQWIPIGENKASVPTAEYLARLIEGEDNLVKMLSEDLGAKLMEAVGVSVADFSLRTIAQDEETRLTLIKSLANITEATGNDTDRVRALAQEIKNHPEVLAWVEEHKAKREKVHRNQAIGALVEQQLKEVLEAKGLKVTRTGVGSDFEVENDFTQDNVEVLLKVGNAKKTYLIEIKGTTQNNVRMTVAQARTAVKQMDRFSLCVVSLGEARVTEQAVLERSRFVMDIGQRIEPLWDEYSRLEATKQNVHIQEGDIKLEMTESETRFSVGRIVWESGANFGDAVEYFLNG